MTETVERKKTKKAKASDVAAKIAVNSKLFLGACEIVAKVIDSKPIVALYGNILVEADGECLRMTGTNLRHTVLTTILAEGQTPCRFMFPVLGVKLLQSLPDSPVEISHIKKEVVSGEVINIIHSVEVTCAGSSYAIESESADDFKNVLAIDSEDYVYVDSQQIMRGLMYCKGNVSKDALKTALTGVFFEVKGKDLFMASFDGFTVASFVARLNAEVDKDMTFLLPASAASLLEELDGEDINLTLSGSRIEFSDGRTRVYSQLIDEAFPDVRRVMPTTWETEVAVNVSDLRSALSRATLLSNEATSWTYIEIRDTVELVTVDTALANNAAEAVMSWDFEGAPLRIGLNPNYLARLISKVPSGVMKIRCQSPKHPLMMYPDKEPGLSLLLMHMSLPDHLNA